MSPFVMVDADLLRAQAEMVEQLKDANDELRDAIKLLLCTGHSSPERDEAVAVAEAIIARAEGR